MMYVGDGVWKSGAIAEVTALAERFGVPVVGDPRAVSIKHPLHAGGRRLEQAGDIDPDLILCIGVTHNGGWKRQRLHGVLQRPTYHRHWG